MTHTVKDTHAQNPLYYGTVHQLWLIKGWLANFELPSVKPEALKEQLTIQDIAKLVKFSVLRYLEKKILPREEVEKKRIVDFVGDSSQRIASRVWVIHEKIRPVNRTKVSPLHLEKSEVRDAIVWALAYYHQILTDLVHLPTANREELQKELTPEMIHSIVKIAARKAMGVIRNNQVIYDVIDEVSQNIAAFQSIPKGSGFHKLSPELKKIIVTSENFWTGFDGNDLEQIAYSNIRKFTPQALRRFLAGLVKDDVGRQDIIWDISRNILGVDVVTEEMIIQSDGGYERVTMIATS